MTYPLRFLTEVKSTEAEPPEPVDLDSDFVVILAALLCALICVVGLIAVARCAWIRRISSTAGQSSSQGFANKGLKKKALQSLPIFTYNSSTASSTNKGKFPEECAICLAEFANGDELRMLPQCGHRFHVGCVDMWLGSHSSCPFCRQVLVVDKCRTCGQIPAVCTEERGASEAERRAREDNLNSFLP